MVASGAAPSVRAATGLKPEVLAGRNVMCVVLVCVLPPAASRVEVACGYAPPVDVDLKAGQATATLVELPASQGSDGIGPKQRGRAWHDPRHDP